MNLFTLIIPLIVALVTQIIKLGFDGIKGNLSWRHILNDYGGMPSSHTALVCSLLTIVAFYNGLASTNFLIAFILALIVIRDAMGLRRYIGQSHELLNLLVKKIPLLRKRFQFMPIGHTPLQVLVGAITGFGLTIMLLALQQYYLAII
ncbi:MAG: divergent PAP2 family protein [Candidatus Buchananbacteria bacterium]